MLSEWKILDVKTHAISGMPKMNLKNYLDEPARSYTNFIGYHGVFSINPNQLSLTTTTFATPQSTAATPFALHIYVHTCIARRVKIHVLWHVLVKINELHRSGGYHNKKRCLLWGRRRPTHPFTRVAMGTKAGRTPGCHSVKLSLFDRRYLRR